MKRNMCALLILAMLFAAGCAPGDAMPAYDAEEMLLEAERMLLAGNYEESILTLESLIEVEPANVRGYLGLSDAYVARGEIDRALELLQKGLELTGDERIADRITGMTQKISGVRSIACSGTCTLIVMENGEAYYCGGDGKFPIMAVEPSLIPRKIEGIANVKKAVALPGGCFLITESDELYLWGSCISLPDGISELTYVERDESIPIKLMDGVRDIIAETSPEFGMLIKTDGSLWSWGNNADGELGRGLRYDETEYDNEDDSAFYDYARNNAEYWQMNKVMDNTVCVDFGYVSGTACCAVTEDGGLHVWGCIGETVTDGTKEKLCFNTPQRIYEDIAYAKLYDRSVIALTRDGRLVRIGWQTDDLFAVSSEECNAIEQRIKAIDCASQHVIALGEDGTVYTMGSSNMTGELGIGRDIAWPGDPVTLSDVLENGITFGPFTPLNGTKARAVCAGGRRTYPSSFAVTEEGTLLAWGNNENGQLGNGRAGVQRDDGDKHLILSGVKEAVAGEKGCAYAITENNDLYAWGDMYGDTIIKTPLKIFENVKMVSGTFIYTLILTHDGELYISDIYLQTGNNRDGWDSSQLVKSTVNPDFTRIMTGVEYAQYSNGNFFVIRDDGSAWGWGNNYTGGLGIGSTYDPSLDADQRVTAPTELEDGFKKVDGATYWLKENGDVYYCGPDWPEDILFPVPIAEGMSDISGQSNRGFMVSESGQLYRAVQSRIEAVDIPQRVVDLSTNDHEGLFIDDSNDLYEIKRIELSEDATGYESLGNVDSGLLYYRKVGEGAMDCACYNDGSSATFYYVSPSGELYSWGSNDNGLLGIGDARQEENIFSVELPE